MQIEPAADVFAERYARGETQVVWTTLVSDLETPVSAFLKIAGGRPMSFLLESVEGGATRGRYSIIGLEPDVIWRTVGDRAEVNRSARAQPDAFLPCPEPPLMALRSLIAESRIELPHQLPPMAAGVFGYLGYDMVRLMEELPAPNPDPIGIPDALLTRPTLIIVFDAVTDTITVVTPVRPRPGVSAHAAMLQRHGAALGSGPQPRSTGRQGRRARRQRHRGTAQLQHDARRVPGAWCSPPRSTSRRATSSRSCCPSASKRRSRLPAFALYRALRRVNPAPFLFFLDFGGFAVAGSSPEILVRVRDGRVTIRPIAGTRPRGATPHEDKALEDELLADPKERAEHLMLLDLGRNDTGRVAKIGTVTVTDQFYIERYSQVMHIVSNVEGELAQNRDALDALAAGFPAGTVSGAPKVRAMQIIDELEKEKRGIYAGCVGYFSAAGEMDTCIVLRTALVKDGRMYVQAGAGIVADSDPAAEQQECVNKAKALFRAAEEAHRFASAAGRGQ